MKLVIAYIRPETLHTVKSNLFAHGICSLSVTNVLGAGQQKGYTEVYRGVQTEVVLLKKLRLEIGVSDDAVETAIEAVAQGSRTGAEGDGVIFVLDITRNLRIRTGQPL